MQTISFNELLNTFKNEVPIELVTELKNEIKLQNLEHQARLKLLKDDPERIDNAVYFQNNTDLQYIFRKVISNYRLKSEVKEIGTWRYCAANTSSIQMIVRNKESDFDTTMVENFGIASGNELFTGSGEYAYSGKIPILIVFSINKKTGEVEIAPMVYDRTEKTLLELPKYEQAFKATDIIEPEYQKKIAFEKQPSLKVVPTVKNQT